MLPADTQCLRAKQSPPVRTPVSATAFFELSTYLSTLLSRPRLHARPSILRSYRAMHVQDAGLKPVPRAWSLLVPTPSPPPSRFAN